MKRSALLFALMLSTLLPADDARAAASFDSCTGYINSLPTVISTQGTWCLNKDLGTGMTTGDAITVAVNNVTIDCNEFKIGGLLGGAGTMTVGIRSTDRQNTTVRGCNLRGFFVGVLVEGAGNGHLIENNRLDGNHFGGVVVQGEGVAVLRNRVYDTGAGVLAAHAAAIAVTGGSAEVRDNLVFNVAATPGEGSDAFGILVQGVDFGRIAGNSVRFLTPDDGGTGYGIDVQGGMHVVLHDNHVANATPDSVGIGCEGGGTIARDNFIQGFGEALQIDCIDAGRNSTSGG